MNDSPQDIAGRTPPTLTGYQLELVVPGWVPVAAAGWLGLGPRESPAGSGRLPWPALLRRLADPGAPLPGDDQVLARIWGQPVQLCAITVQPGRPDLVAGLVLADPSEERLRAVLPEEARRQIEAVEAVMLDAYA